MRRAAEVAFAAALVVMFAWASWEARDWADNVRTFPLAVALPGLALALIQLASSARPAAGAADEPSDETLAPAERTRRTAVIVAWILGMFVGVILLGFVVAVPAAAFAYLRAAREGWVTSAAIAALCWAFVYGIFDRLLHVPLPPGDLLRLLGAT